MTASRYLPHGAPRSIPTTPPAVHRDLRFPCSAPLPKSRPKRHCGSATGAQRRCVLRRMLFRGRYAVRGPHRPVSSEVRHTPGMPTSDRINLVLAGAGVLRPTGRARTGHGARGPGQADRRADPCARLHRAPAGRRPAVVGGGRSRQRCRARRRASSARCVKAPAHGPRIPEAGWHPQASVRWACCQTVQRPELAKRAPVSCRARLGPRHRRDIRPT